MLDPGILKTPLLSPQEPKILSSITSTAPESINYTDTTDLINNSRWSVTSFYRGPINFVFVILAVILAYFFSLHIFCILNDAFIVSLHLNYHIV